MQDRQWAYSADPTLQSRVIRRRARVTEKRGALLSNPRSALANVLIKKAPRLYCQRFWDTPPKGITVC